MQKLVQIWNCQNYLFLSPMALYNDFLCHQVQKICDAVPIYVLAIACDGPFLRQSRFKMNENLE
jgi:hypothetical protein